MKLNHQEHLRYLMSMLDFLRNNFFIIFYLFKKGFLCPICHQKFDDHTDLALHYTQTHAQESKIEKENKNGDKNEEIQVE